MLEMVIGDDGTDVTDDDGDVSDDVKIITMTKTMMEDDEQHS